MRNAAQLREQIGHPVIDADGHWLEYGPVLSDALHRIGGEAAVRALAITGGRVRDSLSMNVAARRASGLAQEAFWGAPTRNTRDRATAHLPRLLYERLDEFGIDFSVLFPTSGLTIPRVGDTVARIAACRAFNIYQAELFEPYKDRMTPAALIPMHTPEEAVAELEHAVGQLGLKAAMFNSMIERPYTAGDDTRYWFDMLGLDSAYDYDPVWQKCRELGVSPTFHKGSRGRALRLSPSNFVYNHIGHFAAAAEAVCKALFLGGVTRRFNDLNFAFLEGGVGWACLLYCDLVSHWRVRNREALSLTDPANLDTALLMELADRYGGNELADAVRQRPPSLGNGPASTGQIDELDDFQACGVARAEDIKALFSDCFYFGCEAEDPSNAWAFNARNNPFGARLNALFGSDIGHFDVQNMAGVLPEAYELVEDERIGAGDFKDFVFGNPVRFWGKTNPRFFEGTRVAQAAREILAATDPPL